MTEQNSEIPAPTEASRPVWRRLTRPMWFSAAGVGIVLVGLLTWAVWPERPLAERDPAGHRACVMLSEYQIRGASEDKLLIVMALGEQASKAATESIRSASSGDVFAGETKAALPEIRLAGIDKIHAACENEGVKMPPLVEQK